MTETEEKPKSKGVDRDVAARLREIKAAEKAESEWLKSARLALDVYRGKKGAGDTDSDGNTFNVLWSNVEIKRYAIYSSLPKLDIRRRINDKEPVAKAVSELLERCASYVMDCADLDGTLVGLANDYLLPGRGVIRPKYIAPLGKDAEGADTDEIQYQEIKFERSQFDDYVRGPGKQWNEVPWQAFKHRLTKQEVEKRWPDFAEHLSYDLSPEQEDEDKLEGDDDTSRKLALIYEQWDKEKRKVYWIAKSYKDNFLEVVDDPLNLQDFWPNPEPIRAIEDSSSLIPQTEYSKYQTLAEELEIVTKRRNKIASAMRVRGLYDSSLSEIPKLLEAGDNQMISIEGAVKYMKEGGLSNAVWMLPLVELANVYQVLGIQRQELIGQIYEITGISDIIRGATDPGETASAQQIKANFGSMRLEKQKQAIQKYVRDLLRIVVEIIAENFTRETLSLMSGLSFPTQADQQAAQMELQMLQQSQQPMPGAPPPPPNPQMQQKAQQLQSVMSQPSWEAIEQVMRSDVMREYKIDIETDSTIAVDQQKDQQAITEFMNGMGQFHRFAAEGMQAGTLKPPVIGKIMLSLVRKFRLGRDVEDEIESGLDQPPPPNPAAEAQKAQQQMEQQKQQFEVQKAQMDLQGAQQKHQMEMAKMQAELQIKQQELQLERERLAMDKERMQMEQASAVANMQITAQSAMNKGQYESQRHQQQMEKLNASPQ